MKRTFLSKITTLAVTLATVVTSSGVAGFMQPQQAHAQVGSIVSYVIGGQQVLDGCENITGSRYEAIAAELGIDIEGGIRGGLTALGDELKDPASNLGSSILNGLGDFGGSLADSRIGDAIGALGSDIAGLFDGVDLGGVDLSGFGNTFGSIVGGIGSIAGSPIVGNILGGVVGGLFGGGGPEEVVETGLRKLEQQGQKIALYEQRKMTEKERCLDALARQAGQKALRDLTSQSVSWLQDGFTRFDREGNPGFVENLEQYLVDVDEYEYATYLKETESTTGGPLSGTCNFLRRPILESLTTDYIQNSDPSGLDDINTSVAPGGGGGCALVNDNMSEAQAEAFLKGDFAAGGWTAFLHSTQNPGSNPISAYLQQKKEVNDRMTSARERELQQLQWGQGFLANTNGGFTPASVVQGITERLVTSDISRLELIDEMDEVSGDLSSTLIGQITNENSVDGGLVGLSNLDPSETVGGQASAGSEYLSSRLIEAIEKQLAIEEDIAGLLPEMIEVYNDTQVDNLVVSAQECIDKGNLSNTNADLLIGNIINDQDIFRNTIVLNRTKIDWNGDPLNWIPVIKETSQKKIGWNGRDYDWENDGVDRYYKQGTAEGCEDKDDLLNVSYVVRQEVITDDEFRFNGLFEPLEPNSANVSSFLRDDSAGNADNKSATFIDDKHHTSDMEVYTVWEKQICGDTQEMFMQTAIEGEVKNVASKWQERWYAPVQILFPESFEGQQRFQNSQCDLSSDYQYCLFPAYRAPKIISGEMYKENNEREVRASRCSTRNDEGTHYFVDGGINNNDNSTTTWSTRECVLRNSPEGAAVEWEEGFPGSASKTDLPAYTASSSTNPVQEQLELVQSLDKLLTQLQSEEADFFAIQQSYYTLSDRFNDPDAARNLREQTENFIRDVRDLNNLLLSSGACDGGDDDLDDFGSDILSSTGERETIISSFSVTENQPQGYGISWQSNASNCEATSVPPTDSWDGLVGPNGSRLLPQTELDALPINLISLQLTCTLDGRTDRQTYSVSSGEIQTQGN